MNKIIFKRFIYVVIIIYCILCLDTAYRCLRGFIKPDGEGIGLIFADVEIKTIPTSQTLFYFLFFAIQAAILGYILVYKLRKQRKSKISCE